MQTWQEKAKQALQGIGIQFDFPMAQLTTFKIGGGLDLLVEPADVGQLKRVLDFCLAEQVPWMVLGLCSNLLVRDKGIRGIGIKLAGEFSEWSIIEENAWVGAGAVLADFSKELGRQGLAGLEFACGIPGSVGGAVYMNAGAYDGEMAQVITEVTVYDLTAGLITYRQDDLGFGYRSSRFQKAPQVILKVGLRLSKSCQATAESKIADFTCKRECKQPLEWPSAGSVFRRPEGYFVGPLIEGAGLKGFAMGGARVSPKHAGFIVNTGTATAADVLQLISHIQETIWQKNKVWLVPEIRVIGEE